MFEGEGTRNVRVAYMTEAPIWKTSYRLVLDEDHPPFIQGWAIVDNSTELDWSRIRLIMYYLRAKQVSRWFKKPCSVWSGSAIVFRAPPDREVDWNSG